MIVEIRLQKTKNFIFHMSNCDIIVYWYVNLWTNSNIPCLKLQTLDIFRSRKWGIPGFVSFTRVPSWLRSRTPSRPSTRSSASKTEGNQELWPSRQRLVSIAVYEISLRIINIKICKKATIDDKAIDEGEEKHQFICFDVFFLPFFL